MSLKALLTAVVFIFLIGAFAFSLWAEWGLYSWLAAAQVALIGSYMGKATFILTFILFLVPAMILLFVCILSGGRVVKAVGLGVPALLVLVHLVAAIFFVSSGGTQIAATTFESGIRNASLIPQNITFERHQLPDLKLDQASGVESSGAADELYIPFASTSWPSPETMVVLKSSPENLKKLAASESLKGVLRKMPLPYLVRSTWPQNSSLFAIVIEDQSTVRGLWIPAVVVYTVLLIWAAVTFFKSRRAKSAPQAA